MDDHKEKDLQFHAQTAHVYDYTQVEPREIANEILFRKIVKKIKPGALMIDLGCGTGHMMVRLQPRFDAIIGVDHSDAMIAEARKKSRLDTPAISFIQSDVEAFLASYTGRQPQLISIVGFLHHVEKDDLYRILERAFEMLLPGGQIVIAEPIKTDKRSRLIEHVQKRGILHKRCKEAMPADIEHADEEELDEAVLIEAMVSSGFEISETARGHDICHWNDPPAFWEKPATELLQFMCRGNEEVIAILADKSRSASR